MPEVYKDESGKVIEVRMDEKITDPEHELAVQVPPEADGRNEHPLDRLLQPSAEEVFAKLAGDGEKQD